MSSDGCLPLAAAACHPRGVPDVPEAVPAGWSPSECRLFRWPTRLALRRVRDGSSPSEAGARVPSPRGQGPSAQGTCYGTGHVLQLGPFICPVKRVLPPPCDSEFPSCRFFLPDSNVAAVRAVAACEGTNASAQ